MEPEHTHLMTDTPKKKRPCPVIRRMAEFIASRPEAVDQWRKEHVVEIETDFGTVSMIKCPDLASLSGQSLQSPTA